MNPADQHFEFARSLFREANDAFFLFDPRTRIIIDLNPAALRMTGLDRTAACAMRLEEVFSGASPDSFDRLIQALDKTGFFHSREGYFLRRPSRDPLPVNLSVSRIHIQPETIGLVVARDISERKQAEEALKQVEARYKSLVASTGVIVWELDSDGVLHSISPAFQAITGWSPDDWIGRPLGDLIRPEDREASHRMHERARRGETVPRQEFRMHAAGGDLLDCESLLVTRIREGPADRVLEIVRDITENNRVARAAEQADRLRLDKEAAEHANRAKSEFLSSVSHEIRTPLTAILGFIDLLGEHPYMRGGPAEISRHLDTIGQNSRFLLALIDDLLDISRIESGQLRIEREPCSPREIVVDVVESLRSRAEAKHLRLEVEVRPEVPRRIATDRLRLRQILVNLVDNAIKFTDRGTVGVTARMPDRPDAGWFVEFAVSDTGIGMSESEMSRIFEPFYRVRSSSPDHPPGTGLGLAICDRLARRLGGELTVRSTPQVGSVFSLSIPIDAVGEIVDLPPARESQAPPPPQPRIRARILVTDDNEANQQLIGLRLSRAGAEVVTAHNGREALDRTRESIEQGRPFDAIIMDMQMPVLDGYEAVRQLRAGGFTRPIIAVTAFAMSKDREECLSLGCDDFISKPIEFDRLFARLSRLLEARDVAAQQGDSRSDRAV